MNVADLLKSTLDELTSDFDDTNVGSSAIALTAGAICPFNGSLPMWAADATPDEEPGEVVNVPCALDMRNASMVLTEAQAYTQLQGQPEARAAILAAGGQVTAMPAVEMRLTLPGAKLCFLDPGGEAVALPLYNPEARLGPFTSRPLEIYVRSPFKSTVESIDALHQILLVEGFVQPQIAAVANPESPRTSLWRLVAPSISTSTAGRFRDQENSGIPVSQTTLMAGRSYEKSRKNANGEVIPEFHDFLFSTYENLFWAKVNVALGEPFAKVWRLISCISGVDHSGERAYPRRPTMSNLTITQQVKEGRRFVDRDVVIDFWPERANEVSAA